MKRNLISSYIFGIKDLEHGESYPCILKYFYPELITALVLYSLGSFIDAWFISGLRSTSTYATLGITNTILHFILKLAEAFSVSTVILVGRFNGKKEYEKVGQAFIESFWLSLLVGVFVSSALYFGAYWIYYLYDVPEKMIRLGVPFLRLRAIGIFFTFVYFSFVGFLRGIKNTKTPMHIFVIGAVVFIFCDYIFIFGKLGFPAMGLNGSAIASICQYFTMFVCAFLYVLFDKKNKIYSIKLLNSVKDWQLIKNMLLLSWPIALDKASIAFSYIWLGRMLNFMGKYSMASFSVIKDMERIAFLPAVAFAQIITFLVSNDFGDKDWIGIKSNIKKIIFLTSFFVFLILLVFSIWPETIVKLFDKKGTFTRFSAQVFPVLSVLVFFDLLQLILSGALRGAGNVRFVMITRIILCFCVFVPLSYCLSIVPMKDPVLKFILIYGSFYLVSALMSIVYIYRFRGENWKKPILKGQNDKNKS